MAEPSDARSGPGRVLVRLPNWLGDIVMALPAVGAVREHFAAAHLAAAAPRAFVPVVAAVPGIDAAVALEGETGLRRVRSDAAAIRAGAYDVVVLLTNSFGSALAAWRAGAPERWGYRADGRGWLLTRRVSRRAGPRETSRHHSRYYVRLVRGLGIDAPEGTARIAVREAWRTAADRLLAEHAVAERRPLVGFAPGAAYGGAKRWPPRYVASLANLVATRTGAVPVLVGAAADRETGHAIESELRAVAGTQAGAQLVNLIGRTDLGTLAGVMARCGAFVSNDSGAMHLAAAVGVHVTAIFGPTREWATAPLGPHTIVKADVFCRPCMLRECPIDHRCMKRVSPETVFASLAPHLSGGAS